MNNIIGRGYTILLSLLVSVQSAIVPPPWADPAYNPCASQPGGWQLIYWPPDKKCYRIFQRGYPCPDTMELGPGPDKGTPECNCAPGSAQSARDSKCYSLYQKEPCDDGEYFTPTTSKTERGRWGTCLKAEKCIEARHLLWPRDGRCYPRNQRGPCPEGQLLTTSTESDLIGRCHCDSTGELSPYYFPSTGTCHEHYTTGPCQERGGIFLPGVKCGCDPSLPHYHNATNKCYQLGGIGPCAAGHKFIVPSNSAKRQAECVCKEGHVKWLGNGACYRPFTRGPCSPGYFYSVNVTGTGMAIGCVPLPCTPGKLFFPTAGGCYRVGTQGPCPDGQVVLFQDSVKASIDGISYLGMCGCPNSAGTDGSSFFPMTYRSDNTTLCGGNGARSVETNTISGSGQYESSKYKNDICGNRRGTIAWSDGTCKQLYSQGPCNPGEWIVPDRSKGQRKGRGWKMGKCECRPGYTISIDDQSQSPICQAPTVILAKFLNNKTEKSSSKFVAPTFFKTEEIESQNSPNDDGSNIPEENQEETK